MNKKYLSAVEVEAIYGIPVGTLGQWRTQGRGPDYYKLGEAVRYKTEDIDEYMEERKIKCRR